MRSEEDENYMDESSSEEGPRRNTNRGGAKQKFKPSIDGYADDLMGDDEDRQNLASMTELDREKILGERQSKRDELRRRQEALDKLDRKRGQERFGTKVTSGVINYPIIRGFS